MRDCVYSALTEVRIDEGDCANEDNLGSLSDVNRLHIEGGTDI
jgi:hypothetical protein